MLTLAINTASSKTAIALLSDENSAKIIAEDSRQSQNDEAEKLMPDIAKLLKKSHKKHSWQDITRVMVIKGPGSFTGLRVGVTVANTIAYLNEAELYGIDTFEYHWQALSERPVCRLGRLANEVPRKKEVPQSLLIFAGSRGVYVQLSPKSDPELVPIDELQEFLTKNKVTKVFGDITDDQKSILKNIEFIPIKKTFAQIIQSIDFKKLKLQKIIKPKYIKPPGITQPKKP